MCLSKVILNSARDERGMLSYIEYMAYMTGKGKQGVGDDENANILKSNAYTTGCIKKKVIQLWHVIVR